MNLFVYSDESGVFDKAHNNYFVFGGLLFLNKEDKDVFSRRYIAAERNLKLSFCPKGGEMKACNITNTQKNKLFKLTKNCFRFGVVIDLKRTYDEIHSHKKTKQRYLDFAYKIAIKHFFEYLIKQEIINDKDVENIYFFIDEHTTATNGKYELRESMENEFKIGMFNSDFTYHYPPIFPNLKHLSVNFCDSKTKPLIRAADIIANQIYYHARTGDLTLFNKTSNLHIIKLP